MEVKEKILKEVVRGIECEYKALILENENGEEIFNRRLEMQNDITLYNVYKANTGLLTTKDIQTIRLELEMSQKRFSEVLGLGEVSINRFESGAIQSKAIDNLIRFYYYKVKGVDYGN